MPLEQQAKEGIAVWAGIVDPHYQVETSLLFQNGGVLPDIETLLLLEMSHPWSEWKDTQFSQSLSRVWLFATPWTAARQASLSITNSQSPPKPMSIESGMPSNHLILCCPLLLLPSIFPSIRVFSNESALHIRWSSYWSFSFSLSPSSEYSGLISVRRDWLDLPAVQGTLKSLLQHHNSLLPNKNNWKLNRGCLLPPPPWLWGCFKFSNWCPHLPPEGDRKNLQHLEMFMAAAAEPGGFPFMPLLQPDPGLCSQLPDLFTLAHLSCLVLQLSSQFCEVPEIPPVNFFFA